ncbi:MAG: coproporphyrinogen III oxidase family protein [Desulfobulbaceae bacterium]|nr:coproporphyrinogen III oxidase family protein [Desulfobulbaceae bacterium]
MGNNEVLNSIRQNLFYGSTDYTKNQPDLFVPHKFRMLAPSQMDVFVAQLRESLPESEVLIYVHFPFCFSECLFCNSFPHPVDPVVQQEYLQCLLREMDILAAQGLFAGKKARGIYFGGGTPTSFSNAELGMVLGKIASFVELAADCSVTSEAHPSTLLAKDRIEGLRAIGINRLSVGCQTFDQEILRICNRRNTAEQLKHIVESVKSAGLAVNIDMMTGLPGQTLASVRQDLEILAGIKPDAVEYIRHEIVNPLAVELYKQNPHLVVDSDTLFAMVCATQEWMAGQGYQQNGSFSDDRQWGYRFHWLKEMPIIAFGSRTRSYTETLCYDKHEELSTYCNLVKKGILPVGRFITLTPKERMYRALLLQLQLKAGLNIQEFAQRFAQDPREVFAPILQKLTEYGCLVQDNGCVRLTEYGAYFVEDVCDYITDMALREESEFLVRTPHSEGGTSARLD